MKIKRFILGILLSSQILTYAQISSDAERYDYFFLEAMTEREKGNASAAFELLRHCLEINPEASEAYYYLAHYYLGMKQNGKALEAFRKASELEPDNVSYLETLAQMYLQSQDLKAATETFEKLSKAEPEREDVLGMLVQLYSEDEKQYSKAFGLIFVMLSGIVTLFIRLPLQKTLSPMLVTALPSYIFGNSSVSSSPL